MRRTATTLGLLSLCLAFSGDTEAGLFRRRAPACPAYAPAYPPAAYYAGPAYSAPRPAAAGLPQDPPGDVGGFVAWLNATRAAHGLGPVGYDAGLAGLAAANSAAQQSRGLGHYVGGARRQNSGVGPLAAMPGMWMASGPHRSALLDPTISRVGIAGSGGYWTYNAS